MTQTTFLNDPTDRLLQVGGKALDDLELLAIVLRGSRSVSALANLRDLLEDCGGLHGLMHLEGKELARRGLGRRQRAVMLAALEVGRRLMDAKQDLRPILSRPEKVVDFLGQRFHQPGQEIVGALYLDGRRRLIAERVHFRGSRHMAAVEPAVFFQAALSLRASYLVVFHNHPGGDPQPSLQDRSITDRLARGAKLLGLHLLDHIILGDQGQWYSFKTLLELHRP